MEKGRWQGFAWGQVQSPTVEVLLQALLVVESLLETEGLDDIDDLAVGVLSTLISLLGGGIGTSV